MITVYSAYMKIKHQKRVLQLQQKEYTMIKCTGLKHGLTQILFVHISGLAFDMNHDANHSPSACSSPIASPTRGNSMKRHLLCAESQEA